MIPDFAKEDHSGECMTFGDLLNWMVKNSWKIPLDTQIMIDEGKPLRETGACDCCAVKSVYGTEAHFPEGVKTFVIFSPLRERLDQTNKILEKRSETKAKEIVEKVKRK